MRTTRLCLIGITLLFLIAPVTGATIEKETTAEGCQQAFEALEERTQSALEDAESDREQIAIRERYAEQRQQLQEDCREVALGSTNETSSTTGQTQDQVQDLPTAECRERFSELERETRNAIEEADSNEQRQQIMNEFQDEFSDLQDECGQLVPTNEETITEDTQQTQQRQETTTRECRQNAEGLKQDLVSEIRDTSIAEMERTFDMFIERRDQLLQQCPSMQPDRNIVRQEPGEVTASNASRPPEEPDRNPGTSPGDLAPSCREDIRELQQEFMERIQQNPQNRTAILSTFQDRIETVMRDCEIQDPVLIDVSEAPDTISDTCRDRLEQVSEEITTNTDTSVGDPIPEQYRDQYTDQVTACMAESMSAGMDQRIDTAQPESGQTSRLESLQQQLEQKNERIEELEARIEELESRTTEDEGDGTSGQVPDESATDRPQPDAPGDTGDTGQDTTPEMDGPDGDSEQEPDSQQDEDEIDQQPDDNQDDRSGGIGSRIAEAITSIIP